MMLSTGTKVQNVQTEVRADGKVHLLVLAPLEQTLGSVELEQEPDFTKVSVEEEKLLRVGDLAKVTSKTVRAIHLYEELGLLRAHSRSKGRYRLFGPDAVVRTRWISKMQELGLSLNDIRAIVDEWEKMPSAPDAMARMREVYQRKLMETREQLERLTMLERELSTTLEYLDTCDSCDPDRLISACSTCNLQKLENDPPELVAGLSAQMSSR